MDKHLPRKLATILYADVAGYSRLTGQDEDQTHQQLNSGLNLLTQKIAAHDGNKLHEAGDAILAEFPSVTAAVDAAVQFQKSMATRESSLPESDQIKFRIGINIGEVIHDRDDIYGDGVNIAARIQEIAPPGSLCVSSGALEQLSTETNYSFDDLGYRDFKNIRRPVHVYQLRISELLDIHTVGAVKSPVQGQPLFDGAAKEPLVTKGRCACGSVIFEITQQSLGTGYCHCRTCQRSSGAPVVAWAAFPTDAVKFTRDKPKFYRLSLIAEKGMCVKCGTPVVVWRGLKPQPVDFIVISTMSLDNPEDYAPSWHQGVESQLTWFQIHDDLPRTRCEESPTLQASWGSVGVSDPNNWKELEYEEAILLGIPLGSD